MKEDASNSLRVTWSRIGSLVEEPTGKEDVPNDCKATIQREFPGSFPSSFAWKGVKKILEKNGMTPERTIACSSICSDEINREKNSWCPYTWGENFSLGGIAGLPFAGSTGFKAFASHVPDGGGLFLFVAPHVGVNRDGEVGKVLRHGQCHYSSSCGAGVAGLAWAMQQAKGIEFVPGDEGLDFQMETVKSVLLKNVERIQNSACPQADVPRVLYEESMRRIRQIVPRDSSCPVAILGGIQINTDVSLPDYLMVKDFYIVRDGTLIDVKGEFFDNLEQG